MAHVTGEADHQADREDSFNGARLIRFAETLDATVDELRSLPPGSRDVAQITTIVSHIIEEAESVVPAALAPELRKLVAPLREIETERDLRVVLVELDGWFRGLLGSMGITFTVVHDEEA